MNVMKKAKSAVSTAKDSVNVVKKAKQSVGAVKDTLTAPLKKVKSLVNSEEVELDEMSWFMKAKAKIDQMTHPKAYEAMVKRFIGDMKTPSNKKKTPSSIAAEIAREYSVPSRGLIQYINKLVDKGILPKELKAEYQEESFTFKDFVNEMNEVKQDPDIKDDPGTEPAKYYKGVEKKVKPKRDAHFEKGAKMDDDNPAAYTPAPGDKGAVTKPSVHTNKFKRMYGEDRNYKKEYENYHSDPKQVKRRASRNKARREMVNAGKSVEGKDVGHKDNNPLNNSPSNLRTEDPSKNRTEPRLRNEKLGPDSTMGDYVKDFKKSDAPQFKGKTDRKKHTMAVAAFLSRNEALLDWVDQKLTENGHTDVASMKNKVAVAYKALEKMQSELEKLGDEDDLPTWWTNKVATAVSRIDDMSDYLDTQVDEAYQLDEKIAGLVKKADKSGMPYGILKKVYDRGMAAWRTGHRPGTTPQQWAMARVNSFTTKSSGTWGKADKDLASQVREMNEIDEACWDTHKQVGMKKKGGKMVPNCVPKSEEYEDELNEWGEIEEDSEYEGRKVKLNKPMAGDVKKSKVYVKNEKGNVVKVEFGDPNMTIKKHIPARRKSFRARHNCDNPGPKWKARYWSCKAW